MALSSVPPSTIMGPSGLGSGVYKLLHPHSLSLPLGPHVSLSLLPIVLHFMDKENRLREVKGSAEGQTKVLSSSPGLLCG